MKKLFGLVALLALSFILSAQAEKEVTFGSFALSGVFKTQDSEKAAMKACVESLDIDCSIYENAGASGYFINSDFKTASSSYHVEYISFGVNKTGSLTNFRYFFTRNGEYQLVNCPTNDVYKSADNTVGVFRDKYNQEFVIANLRNTYTKASYLTPIQSFLEGLKNEHPQAIMLVSYNGRTHREVTKTTPVQNQDDFLHDYLVSDTGPQLTCLGRGVEGGFYTDSASLAKMTAYSVVDAPIEGFYTGVVARISMPARHRIIFTDWDDTVMQTNIVKEGESVTPPVPTRAGFTFAGWEGHPDSDFEAVTSDFVAKAMYTTSGNVVTFVDWDSTPIDEVAVAEGETVAEPERPIRLDHTFKGWKVAGGGYWNFADVVTDSMTLTADYELDPELKIGSADDFLRLMAAGYPASEIYAVTNDIDFTGRTFTPVDFAATLDGCGHVFTGIDSTKAIFDTVSGTVRNLVLNANPAVIEVSDEHNGALALTLSGATIENVTIRNWNRILRKTNGSMGVLASRAVSNEDGDLTIVSNCVVRDSSILSLGAYKGVCFGGFVAWASGAEFCNCQFLTESDGLVIGGNIAISAGGILGRGSYPGRVKICGCYAEGRFEASTPTAYSDGCGGIVGGMDGSNTDRPHYLVFASTNRATLVGQSAARYGGIVGMASKTNVRIERCVNDGAFEVVGANETLNSYHGAGGLIGGFWSNYDVELSIVDSVNFANVLLPTNGVPVGGLVGRVNIVEGIVITNSFNYGNVESDVAAGGIVGRAESTPSYSFVDVGNAGLVTASEGAAGGIIGRLLWENRSSASFDSIMQCGDVTAGTNFSGNVIGYVTGRFYQSEMSVSNAVLAGTVATQEAEGQAGLIAGGVLRDDATSENEMTWTISDVHATDMNLAKYYTRANEPVMDVEGISEMTDEQLQSKKARDWLNAGRKNRPWVRGRSYPELERWGTPYAPGLMLLVR